MILAGAYSVEGSPLFLISRLGTLVGMVLVGIAAVAVRRWRGWRRFSPFALLLALPLTVLLGIIVDEPSVLPCIGLARMAIGYAVWSSVEME